MKPFNYFRPKTLKEAIDAVATDPEARFIAGGTNLIDLMKRGIVSPGKLVDINHLPLKRIERKTGFLRIGALALNSEVVNHKLITEKHPLLVQALNAGASGQLRNMATVGGNILQQTRCTYFYDKVFPCNKREPGAGCSALEGVNRMHAIFGIGEKEGRAKSCIAVNPSDLNVALAALDTIVVVSGPKGERRIAFHDFHRLPGERPDLNTNLGKDELIIAIEIPDSNFTKHVHYLKVRDRASYAFALVSVAVGLNIEFNRIKAVRLAMGGVAHKPWRLYEAENLLLNESVSETVFQKAAEIAMKDAVAFGHNAYKLKIGSNAIVHALKVAAGIF